MRSITLVLPYYDNPSMLVEQQRVWTTYPLELRTQLHVIVVDDGSPRAPALPHFYAVPADLASFALYRTGADVRWNWLFCRNLGVSVAPTDWVMLTDIDHVMPVPTLRRLLEGPFDPQCAYRFVRIDAPKMTPYKPHPNTWFLTRALFDQIGGYDERFSGFYGTDGEFRRRVSTTARKIVILDAPMIRYPREVIADASTTTYTRKEKRDKLNVRRIINERASIPHWRPLRLTFPYRRLL